MAFTVEKARILSDHLYVDVVDHCNLLCRSCAHLSPIAGKRYVCVQDLRHDFSVLGTCFHAKELQLIGGEPLLHPELPEIATAARAVGIADRIIVKTNGLLLDRVAERLWDVIDRIVVSIYPGREPSARSLAALSNLAHHRSLEVVVSSVDVFRESYSEVRVKNRSLVERIYRTCQMAHGYGCYSLHNGYFFKCPLAHSIPGRLPQATWNPAEDGVKLEDIPTLFARLKRYLDDTTPLNACQHCLGTVGKLFVHQQTARTKWRQHMPPENLLDKKDNFSGWSIVCVVGLGSSYTGLSSLRRILRCE
jgi:organic radical activating enzyme